MGVAVSYILAWKEILLKTNDTNNEEKATELSERLYSGCKDYIGKRDLFSYLISMAQWKDEQFKEQLFSLKDEIQSNLCASSGFNDEYSHGYQDCGMKVIEMIDKILK